MIVEVNVKNRFLLNFYLSVYFILLNFLLSFEILITIQITKLIKILIPQNCGFFENYFYQKMLRFQF